MLYFMKLSRDIQSLSVFKRDTAKFRRQLKKTKEPIVLTVNGKADMVVLDPDTYQDYLREKNRREAVEGIRRGLAGACAHARPLSPAIRIECGQNHRSTMP